MKTLLILLSLPFCAFSQFSSNDPQLGALYFAPSNFSLQWNNAIYYSSSKYVAKENKVASVTTYSISKKGKKELANTKTFNTDGRVVKLTYKTWSMEYVYKDTLLTEVISIHPKRRKRTIYRYDEQNRIIASMEYMNEKLTDSYRFEYFDEMKRNVVEHIHYKRKAMVYLLTTSYDSLLKSPVSAVYTVNGKITKTWNYDCKEKGEIVKNSVEAVSSKCEFRQENNDGSYTKFARTVENGKTYLSEWRFSKDSVFLEYYKYYSDTILVEHHLKEGNRTVYERFSVKGKKQSSSEYERDDYGNQLSYRSYNRRNKLTYSTKAIYNSNNLITENLMGEKWKHVFEYTFYSN